MFLAVMAQSLPGTRQGTDGLNEMIRDMEEFAKQTASCMRELNEVEADPGMRHGQPVTSSSRVDAAVNVCAIVGVRGSMRYRTPAAQMTRSAKHQL